LKHWGPHGGALDGRDPANPRIIIAMSDQQEIKRFTVEGRFIDKIAMPGGNPRDIVLWGEDAVVPHLGDQWPKDKNAPGFISVVDRNYKIVSNIGAPPAVYENGVLQPMKSDGKTFIHPHGVAVDAEGNLYVAQFASPAAPLLKLERLK
jgi:peptidylamidoglycolate lyase